MKPFARSIAALFVASFALTSQAGYIYNNAVNDPGQRLEAVNGLWFGDEVILAGTDRFMTGFDFQFWGTNLPSGVTVDVELRLQDGPLYSGYASPGTLIYAYSGFGISDTPRSTLVFNAADLDLYDGITDGGTLIAGNIVTLAVRFNGLTSGQAGVDLYGPIAIGGSYPDYWQFVGGQWQLTTNNFFSTVNFGMRIEAVPEPSVFALLAMGGGLAMVLGRRFIRRK